MGEPLEDSYDDVLAQAYNKACQRHRHADGMMFCWRQENLGSGLGSCGEMVSSLTLQRPFRYVGVCYKKDTERKSHYVETSFARHCDAHVFIYKTQALTPLHPEPRSVTSGSHVSGQDKDADLAQ